MKEYIPFDKVMGRIENSNNYNRLNITLPNKHAEAVLRYNCGLFVVFKSKSSILEFIVIFNLSSNDKIVHLIF